MDKEKAMSVILENKPNFNKNYNNLLLWDEEKTLKENSINIGITIMAASLFKREYKLICKKVRGWRAGPKPASFKVRAYMDLNKSGWGIQEIADVFKVTKQCVDQSIKDKESCEK